MAADTAPAPVADNGGITSKDYWEARWAKALSDAKAEDDKALLAHTESEWHSGRFRFETLSCTFAAASSASAVPRCSAFGGNTGIASGVITTVNLTGVAFDPDGWCSLAANTITVPDEGDYEIHAYVGWSPEGATDPTTGTYRVLYLDLTPGYDRSRQDPPPPAIDVGLSEFSQETTLFEHLAAGTVISLKVSHDATGPMIVGAATESLYTARLTVVQLG